MIRSGDFDDNLLPNLLNVAGMITQVRDLVVEEEEQNSPMNILNQVFQFAEDIEDILNSNGQSLLDPKNQLANLIVSKLTDFIGEDLAESLEVFRKTKDNLLDIKNNGKDYLDSIFSEVTSASNFTTLLAEIKALVPEDSQREYEQMIERASQIFQFLDYVRDNGLDYKTTLERLVDNHGRSLMDFFGEIANIYFQNQTSISDSLLSRIRSRVNAVETELQGFHNLVNNFYPQTLANKLNQQYQRMVNSSLVSAANSLVANKNNLISKLEASAAKTGQTAANCCR